MQTGCENERLLEMLILGRGGLALYWHRQATADVIHRLQSKHLLALQVSWAIGYVMAHAEGLLWESPTYNNSKLYNLCAQHLINMIAG